MSEANHERAPLLANGAEHRENAPYPNDDARKAQAHAKTRGIVGVVLTLVFIVILVVSLTVWNESLSRDPNKAALSILSKAPVIDGHIDLPILVRGMYRNNVTAFDLRKDMPAHVDIPRLRKGHVGGFFWSVYVSCEDEGRDFLRPTNRARDTLEQIDVARLMIEQYGDVRAPVVNLPILPDDRISCSTFRAVYGKHYQVFQLATDVAGLQNTMFNGKIASMLGVEGAHQLGNSLGVLRTYYTLGVRYVTLTHSCNNAFADSAGITEPPKPAHGGLSSLGRTLIREMNRLGMLVDLSHTSDATAVQALALTEAPVIWSHSSARAVWNHPRNVPDSILKRIGLDKGKKDAIVMVNFAPYFVAADGNATVKAVADHVEHIGKVSGRQHVGLGSDFDGIASVPQGLEDVSKYPGLFAELRSRGWSKADLVGLAGGNLIRVWQGAEAVAWRLQDDGIPPAAEIYKKRKDL